ncbi:MAG: CDP-alcohol phosphatidyltransferase family protein [Rhodothermales bacterium]|nr:CDP-alcohol phosphatidyltransferase family protein [Rhodothermales bacterium]
MTDGSPPAPLPDDGWLPDLGRFWTVPNMLSMVRLVLVMPLAYLILVDGPLYWMMILLVLIVATDYFDGRIARWSQTVSEWGKVLDPMADKMAGGLVVMALAINGALPLWLLAVVAARDLAILVGGAVITKRTGVVLMSLPSGKIAVTALAITVLAALLRADPPVLQACIWGTTALLGWSFLRYLVRFVKVYRYGTEAIEARS